MSAANHFDSRFRKTKMPDFTFVNQILHSSGHVFDRHSGIDPMLIEQIDVVGLQSRKRGVSDFLDVLRPAINA